MIKCIAIDDEPIALSILRQYAGRRGGLELETYTSPPGQGCSGSANGTPTSCSSTLN